MIGSMYPEGIRENCFATDYCEIAVEAYYKAIQSAKVLEEINYVACDNQDYYSDMEKNVVITIVFSAMCIESFLNDYAAACLGDSEFYDNFDKLSEISKLELISKFILKTTVDKEKSYYSQLKTLIKARNSYVHNKSKDFDINTYREENSYLVFSEDECEPPVYNKVIVKEEIKSALNALKAIRDIALFFDEHDSGAYALYQLFRPLSFVYESEYKTTYKNFVYSELGIKRSFPNKLK